MVDNPALRQFVAELGSELQLAQVLIRRQGAGYELRHVADSGATPESLRLVKLAELRQLAQYTAGGAFRPLKSAPDLQRGWRFIAAGDKELESALGMLYPGAIADWHAAQGPNPPVTNYREFTNRQSGMYRITAMLNDDQAAQVIRAGCDARFCLKRRLWTVTGLPPDAAEVKSLIPCLEPCAVLMEFARKAMRIEQEEKLHLELAPADVATIHAALEVALANLGEGAGEQVESMNPRQFQLVLEKLRPALKLASKA
jgi:hypothetical protein